MKTRINFHLKSRYYFLTFRRRSGDVEAAVGWLISTLFSPLNFWGKSFNFPLEIRDVRKRQAVGAFPFDFLLTPGLNHVGIRSG